MNTDIRISVSFKNHRKRTKLRMILGDLSTDYLLDLWLSVAMDRPDGNLQGLDEMDIAIMAGWTGEPKTFVDALVTVGFLKIGEVGELILPDWKLRQKHLRDFKVCARLPKNDWVRIRHIVFKRDGYKCRYCGATHTKLECDHILPISRGGNNELHNLATACKPCNRSKYNKTIEEWLQ